jgi:hypothetical protein
LVQVTSEKHQPALGHGRLARRVWAVGGGDEAVEEMFFDGGSVREPVAIT